MRLRVGLLAAVLLAAPASAQDAGPVITTARACYLAKQQVALAGTGFGPGDTYSVTLDHTLLGTGTVNPDTTISGSLSSGTLGKGVGEVLHRIIVSDGTLQARVGFHVSAFDASFAPGVGDPRSLRVRYTVNAIGFSAPQGSIVWVHYLNAAGHLKRSVAIGRTKGVCGSLHRSILHRLFPFRATPGTWRLQFDLEQGYSPKTRPRIVRDVAVG
ncbi:MAG TPA: hypothetical protein VIJ51_12655 [Solirubrobacteraceae bacterium]